MVLFFFDSRVELDFSYLPVCFYSGILSKLIDNNGILTCVEGSFFLFSDSRDIVGLVLK